MSRLWLVRDESRFHESTAIVRAENVERALEAVATHAAGWVYGSAGRAEVIPLEAASGVLWSSEREWGP